MLINNLLVWLFRDWRRRGVKGEGRNRMQVDLKRSEKGRLKGLDRKEVGRVHRILDLVGERHRMDRGRERGESFCEVRERKVVGGK
jgi:hypothetical protein